MGNLFPPPEVPDHQPIPTSFPTPTHTIAIVAMTGALYGLCPKNEDREEHPLHEGAHEVSCLVGDLRAGVIVNSTGSTGSERPLAQGNSVFEANDRIIRNMWEQGARRRMAASSSSTMWIAAVLSPV